jgi:non-heme chloroperoxidase
MSRFDTNGSPEAADAAGTIGFLARITSPMTARAGGVVRDAYARLDTGITMHFVEAGPRDAPAVVLLHGFPDSWQVWEAVIPVLAEDFRVLAIDQRGQGDTDKPQCCYAPGDFVADVAAFMDALSVERAAIIGHSFGSFVAQNFAMGHPDRVDRLVLVGSGVAFDNALGHEFRAFLPDVTDAPDPEMVREFQRSTFHRLPGDDAFDRIIAQSMKTPGHVWRSLGPALAENRTERLRAVTAPTLLVAGDRDALFPLDEQHRLFRALPDAELTCYPDTGHFIQLEQPQRFVADLLEFLAAAPAAL